MTKLNPTWLNHVDDLHIKINSCAHLFTMMLLSDCLSNLKNITVVFINFDIEAISIIPVSLQTKKITSLSRQYCKILPIENITNVILLWFSNIAKFEIISSEKFDVLKLMPVSLPHLESFVSTSEFDFKDAAHFFIWISSSPQLTLLDVVFSSSRKMNHIGQNNNLLKDCCFSNLKSFSLITRGALNYKSMLIELFSKFTHLTNLKIHIWNDLDFDAITNCFKSMQHIRHLDAFLRNEFQFNYLIGKIILLKSLTRLVKNYCQSYQDVERMLNERLQNLFYFYLNSRP